MKKSPNDLTMKGRKEKGEPRSKFIIRFIAIVYNQEP